MSAPGPGVPQRSGVTQVQDPDGGAQAARDSAVPGTSPKPRRRGPVCLQRQYVGRLQPSCVRANYFLSGRGASEGLVCGLWCLFYTLI